MGGTLSRGMKQRLVLAKTLIHDPKVLLLDEPASGLDPLARIALRNLLRALSTQGKTVLISSHILTELSDFCTSIGVMEQGRLLECGRIDQIVQRNSPRRRFIIEINGELNGTQHIVEAFNAVEAVQADGVRLFVDFTGNDDDASDLLELLVRRNVRIKSFFETKPNVEDILLRIGGRQVS